MTSTSYTSPVSGPAAPGRRGQHYLEGTYSTGPIQISARMRPGCGSSLFNFRPPEEFPATPRRSAGSIHEGGKQQLKDKLIEHRQPINKYGEELPEIRNWKWDETNAGKPA